MLQFLLTQISKIKAAISSTNNKFRIVESGSLHDITETGIYYVKNAVTDKPGNQGGFYCCSVLQNNVIAGLYSTLTGVTYSVRCNYGSWDYFELALKE